jgi:stress response protein YsnF
MGNAALSDVTMTTDSERDPINTISDPRLAGETNDSATLRLAAEELSVAKATTETGRVRVSTHTHEREVPVDENLVSETTEIETIPVGLRIHAVPEVRHEGDITIIPVVEEVLFLERRLMLKEEVRIRRVRTTERFQEKVTLRYQEAVISRVQGATDQTDPMLGNNGDLSDAKE